MFNFTIFGQPNCVDCNMAKITLDRAKMTYNYVDVTTVDGYKEFRKAYAAARTVPLIVLNEPYERIGTLGELREWLKAFTPKS